MGGNSASDGDGGREGLDNVHRATTSAHVSYANTTFSSDNICTRMHHH